MHPKTCQPCGYQEGDLGDHVWNTEICGAAATCEICGLEGTNAREHSVQIGYCEYCNQFQNKELYDTLQAELTVVHDKLEVICGLVEEVYSDPDSSDLHYLAAIESLHPRFTECKETVEHLIELCGRIRTAR